ncbi:hypothetical protein BVX95_00935 [archaeon D22]|nr:hypothetical protein BVX95_00935 [archaeon D22]
MIIMLKEGLSIELAKTLLKKKYENFVSFDNDSLFIQKEIMEKMKDNNENEILIFEVQYYVNK